MHAVGHKPTERHTAPNVSGYCTVYSTLFSGEKISSETSVLATEQQQNKKKIKYIWKFLHCLKQEQQLDCSVLCYFYVR